MSETVIISPRRARIIQVLTILRGTGEPFESLLAMAELVGDDDVEMLGMLDGVVEGCLSSAQASYDESRIDTFRQAQDMIREMRAREEQERDRYLKTEDTIMFL